MAFIQETHTEKDMKRQKRFKIRQKRVGLATKGIYESLLETYLPMQGPPGGPSVPFSHVHCNIEWLADTTVVDLSGQSMQDACRPLRE